MSEYEQPVHQLVQHNIKSLEKGIELSLKRIPELTAKLESCKRQRIEYHNTIKNLGRCGLDNFNDECTDEDMHKCLCYWCRLFLEFSADGEVWDAQDALDLETWGLQRQREALDREHEHWKSIKDKRLKSCDFKTEADALPASP